MCFNQQTVCPSRGITSKVYKKVESILDGWMESSKEWIATTLLLTKLETI